MRAVVTDPADHAGFDLWHHEEPPPAIVKAFSTRAVWHGWNKADPYMIHVWHLYFPHTVTGRHAIALSGAFVELHFREDEHDNSV